MACQDSNVGHIGPTLGEFLSSLFKAKLEILQYKKEIEHTLFTPFPHLVLCVVADCVAWK